MTQKFQDLPLNCFRDEKDFLDRWVSYVQTLVSNSNSKHIQRIEIIQRFKNLGVEPDDRLSIEIDSKCLLSKEVVTKAQHFMRFAKCTEYHKFSAKAIFNQFLSCKPSKFSCPLCSVQVKSIKDFKLDILSFQYFPILEDGKSKMEITAVKFDPQSESPHPQSDNETIIAKQKKKVNWLVERLPNEFSHALSNSRLLQTQYEKCRVRKDKKFRGMLTLPNGQAGVIIISLLCVLSQKRILFPLMHADCQHSIHTVAIFDLYTLLVRLEKNRDKAIKCPVDYCKSQFTFDNYQQKGIFDESLRNYVKGQPLCNITLCFNIVGNENQWMPDDQQKSRNQRIPLGEVKTLFTNPDSQFRDNVKKQVKKFFKFNKLQETKYEQQLKKLKEKNQVTQNIKINLSKNLYKECVPVRCISCNSFDGVLDLWHYSALLVVDEQKQIQPECPICKTLFNMNNPEACMYIDYRMWDVTKMGFKNIIFNPEKLCYSIDVTSITYEHLMNVMMKKRLLIKNYPPETDNFTIKLFQLNPQQLPNFIPVVLKKCYEDNKGNIKELIAKHMIFKLKGQVIDQVKCLTCKTSSNDIEQILLDMLVRDALVNGQGQLIQKYIKKTACYAPPVKISTMATLEELQEFIIENGQMEDGPPINKIVVDIRKKSTSNKGTYDNIIQIPVIIRNCRRHSDHDHRHQRLFDLKDIFGQGNTSMRKCAACSVDIIYVSQIIMLPQLRQAISLLGNFNMDSLEKGVLMLRVGPDDYKLQPNPNTQRRPPNIYEQINSLQVTTIFTQKPYGYELNKLTKDFSQQIQALPRNIVKNQQMLNEVIVKTGGGINVYLGRNIPRFNPNENRA